jgi:hypothetical protein
VAEADVQPHEIQELSELLGDLKKAAADHELRFHLRIELGDAKKAADDVVDRLQALLAKISEKLILRKP